MIPKDLHKKMEQLHVDFEIFNFNDYQFQVNKRDYKRLRKGAEYFHGKANVKGQNMNYMGVHIVINETLMDGQVRLLSCGALAIR